MEALYAALTPAQDLTGEKVLITAGPTREPIDPVRYISNRSSGKMGYGLATAALRTGVSSYVIGKQQTLALLRSWGYPEPRDYELHVPLVMDKGWLVEILHEALRLGPYAALAYRTVYATVAELGGESHGDVKIVSQHGGIPAGWPLVSTSDGSFSGGKVGREIRARFPHRSIYEGA